MNIKHLSIALMMGATLAACNTGGNDSYTTTQSLASCVNVIVDQNDMSQTVATGVGYTILYDYTNNVATITIEGLKLPDGQSFGQLTFADVPWTYKGENGWKVAEISAVRPTSPTSMAPLFRTFRFALIDRTVSGAYFPCLDIQYTIDNYSIVSMPSMAVFSGKTTVTDGTGKELVNTATNEAIYAISLNFSTYKAELQIANAFYSTSMSPTTIVMRDVPFTVDRYGRFTLQRTEAFTPYTSTSSTSTSLNEDFSVSNLQCTADDANFMNLSFDIQVKADADLGPAHVAVSCEKPAM